MMKELSNTNKQSEDDDADGVGGDDDPDMGSSNSCLTLVFQIKHISLLHFTVFVIIFVIIIIITIISRLKICVD